MGGGYDSTKVEFKELYKACDLKAGDRITKAMMRNNLKYPVIGGGVEPTGFYSDFNFENAITISRAGANAGFVGFQKNKFWATDVCFVAIGKDVVTKFVFYFLKTKSYELQQHLYGGSIPKLNKNYLWNLQIPIPPLEVQKEIVKILDKFDDLINDSNKGLKAEITARHQQYVYYREKLLSF
ncbi:restriction endonuclease subunit S [Helicobacter sp. 13S00477-4]|uniref:restriction endonuclease subunit S n=1 Tax=Helicobacter sp. 13S00477-4 TaxID=1905759 RepID=UPI000BA633E8|nr:restriction endonuclease subunit S [Helicobacter sp. 13S00477-4]PAF52536.1 hypothetical protein BKH44_01790 [Helicobacter sp. 13S00477-4]